MDAEDIVRALAALEDGSLVSTEDGTCVICRGLPRYTLATADRRETFTITHKPDCPLKLAVAWVADHPGVPERQP